MGAIRIGLCWGDSYGVGPEIVKKVIESRQLNQEVDWLHFVPQSTVDYYGIQNIEVFSENEFKFDSQKLGQGDAASGKASAVLFRLAVEQAMQNKIDAVVTGPINKQAVLLGGENLTGHTEIIKQMTGVKEVVMTFFSPFLNVALQTVHVPLKEVSNIIAKTDLVKTYQIVNEGLKSYGIKNPRIAVAGLNPHAGEEGIMGDEDIKILLPAIQKAKEIGINISGPFSGDTLFYRAMKKEFDLVIAQYHDQGLAPLKAVAFDTAVNVSLGSSVIRTSVDHGTGFDIVGKNLANPQSLLSAIDVAIRFVKNRK
jgi:4-hydroxythreonine-4-phosphate dehydrogenase